MLASSPAFVLPSSGAASPAAAFQVRGAASPTAAEQAGVSRGSTIAAVGVLASAAALLARKATVARQTPARDKQVVTLAAFETELGVQAPLGFWDPMGFTKDGDVDDFKRRRESEIKHGRIAMFATIGYIWPELFGKFGGYCSTSELLQFSQIPNGLGALKVMPVEGSLQIVAFAGFLEIVRNGEPINGEPGNYGQGRLGITGDSIKDPEQRKRSLNAEIANGRLAMMAIIGMFFQDGLTGSAWGDWANYTASPLR